MGNFNHQVIELYACKQAKMWNLVDYIEMTFDYERIKAWLILQAVLKIQGLNGGLQFHCWALQGSPIESKSHDFVVSRLTEVHFYSSYTERLGQWEKIKNSKLFPGCTAAFID